MIYLHSNYFKINYSVENDVETCHANKMLILKLIYFFEGLYTDWIFIVNL